MQKRLRTLLISTALISCPLIAVGQETNPMLMSMTECKGPVGSTTPPVFRHNPVLNCPDEFAWDLFIKLSHPAIAGKPGVPDLDKKLGDEGDTVWESWKLRREVFLKDGCKPFAWGAQTAVADAPRFAEPASKAAKVLIDVLPEDEVKILFDPNRPSGETRLNQAAFDFIVANELYHREGQIAFHNARRVIDFPPDAREIKSGWRVLGKGQEKEFYTVEFSGKIYGLVALHIISKDIPQWFWSTFEHKSLENVEVPQVNRYVDRHTAGGANLPSELTGTVWANYRLKGTQVEYVDLTGEPTILGNTIMEAGFMSSSSCITCHARAVVDGKGEGLPVFDKIVNRSLRPSEPQKNADFFAFFTGTVGIPDPTLYYGSGSDEMIDRLRTQLDFMWSLTAAQPKSPRCPE